jgi:hypothetical protein
MPGPIRDSQIKAFFNQLPEQGAKINDNNVLQLLAAVGDNDSSWSWWNNESSILSKLQSPNISRQEQFELVKGGMKEQEAQDLASALDNSNVSFSPGARNFLEALTGRQSLGENFGPLVLQGAGESLKGIANAGDEIEVVNISANPEAALGSEGTKIKADEWGRFQGNLGDVQQGDHLRVRTRDRQGNVSNWITMQANQVGGEDTRNAQIYADALGMEADGDGNIDLIYLGDGMVSEPGAKVQLTNERTGESFVFTADANGQLPDGAQIKGKGGDEVSIAVSDGVNNINFAEKAGSVQVEKGPEPVDFQDPAVWAKKHLNEDGESKYTTKRFEGPLFVDEPTAADVQQGSLANCYFAAAAASVAHTDADRLKDMITKNPDGSFTVTFQQETYYGSGRFRDKKVTVDGDLYVSYGEKPLYGRSMGTKGTDEMEMWFPILEKAYANLKGNSYDKIGNGGSPSRIMSELVGGRSSDYSINENNMESVYNRLEEAVEKGWPITATTYGKDSEEAERYSGEKIYPWHVYSVLGVEDVDGEKFVQIRNPWGKTEPGYDGKDDGIFKLPLDKFAHFYKNISFARG